MEPDIIRMYSSSPPPLDNGAEEDEEEEFGDFGGFAGAGSSNVGFDFASDYSGSIEEHKSSYNSDYSGNVDSIIAFTAIQYANDKENITELPNSIKQLPDRENCECKHFGTSFDEDSPVEVKRSEKPESPYPKIIRTDMNVSSQDQQVNICNGEKPCREFLTNGFVASDTANSQGVEDLDSISDSKGLKTISTHNTELSLDSIASTAEDFADFAAFSNKQTIQGEETENKICNNSCETVVLRVQENNIRNRIGGRESMKEATSDGIYEYEGEMSTEGERINISKIDLVIVDDLKAAEVCTEFEHNVISSIKTNVNSVGTSESTEVKGESDTGNSKEHTVFQTNDTAKTLNFNINRVHSLSSLPAEETVHASETIRNSESCTKHPSCSESSEDDFGDFGTVSNGSPVFTDGAQASTHQEHFQVTNDSFSKLSYECDDFTDRSDMNQQSTEIELPQSNAVSSTELEEHLMSAPHSGMKMPPPAGVENRDDCEFGDFGSMAKRLPDSDDFSDFSAAGCNQTVEWKAFEPEQQESCMWADFEEQPVVESQPGRDTWPSHRTGSTSGMESSLTQSVCITSLHGTGNEQLQELPASARTALLRRLERIFEASFPSVPVSELEEEIVPLTLLLEMCNKPERTEETILERELFDVWTEIQDIHDAYGLKYQWGGSHNNKKLLCSLGIDTRNILFTGNKKQPVIVPMYAAGLGMLEPTKEPLKPLSAAEKIASLGQTSTVSSEMNICAPDQSQESLPPVQFDWSSSGLTNPLDASGGSTLLNLDFFGPVDDSSSSTTTTIPGVDPELYELTTSKLETSNTTSKVTDAFAKLMSTVERATSSTRKPKKEEQLSEEAAKVISSLPDLTFMHAKVLMFPATLTPSTSCQAKVD